MSIQKKRWFVILFIFLPAMALAGIIWYISFIGDYTATEAKKNMASILKTVDSYSIMEIEITMEVDAFQNMLDTATEEIYSKADITINGETFENVGIRPKGNSTLSQIASDPTTNRYSFKVKLDEYIDGQNYQGMTKLVLNSNMSDTTYLKEFMSYEIMEEVGVATPMHAFTNISINGEVWGLYLFVEPIEESFIERNYGTVEGNLYKPESDRIGGGNNRGDFNENKLLNPPNDIPDFSANENAVGENKLPMFQPNPEDINPNENTGEKETTNNENQGGKPTPFNGAGFGGMNSGNGMNLVYTSDDIADYAGITASAVFKQTNETDFQKLIPFMKNMSTGENLESVMHVDEFIRYFAANTFLVNLDHYAGNMLHNYYLYENQGIFEILPWDYNLSFGTFGSNAKEAINFPVDKPTTAALTERPLIDSWLQNDTYKEQYHKYLMDIVAYVESGQFEKMVTEMDHLISDYVKNDPTAFYTFEEYTAGIENLMIFAADRSKSIVAQLNGTQPSEKAGTLETTLDISALGSNGFGGKGDQGGMTADRGNLPAIPNEEETIAGEGNFLARPTQDGGNFRPDGEQVKGDFPARMGVLEQQQQNSYTEWIFAVGVGIVLAMVAFILLKFQRRKSM